METQARLSQLQTLLQGLFELSSSPGASIAVHHGEPILTAHFGRRRASNPTSPNDDTLYNVGSITSQGATFCSLSTPASGSRILLYSQRWRSSSASETDAPASGSRILPILNASALGPNSAPQAQDGQPRNHTKIAMQRTTQ